MSISKDKTETGLPLTETGSVDNERLAERSDEPGFRTGSRVGHAAPRPHGADEYLATLVRGISYRVVYAGRALVFERGKPTAINATEFERLRDVHDRIDFHDGDGRVLRHIRKLRFTDLDGEPVQLDDIPDQHLGAAGMDAAEQAALARKFEGDDRPRAG